MKLLGSRDHSEQELSQKLQSRNHALPAIESALESLKSANYVNDERYANLFAEQRVGKGYGPLSIQSKLRERGIDAELIALALEALPISWIDHASEVLERRFDSSLISSQSSKDEARIARFLASRGFTPGVALRALKQARHKYR